MMGGPQSFLKAMASPAARITLTTMRIHVRQQGFVAREPILPAHLMVVVETGRLHVRSQGRSCILESGDALWLPPGADKQFHCDAGEPSLKQWNLRFDLRRGNRPVKWAPLPQHRQAAWELIDLFGLLRQIFEQGHPYQELRTRALLMAVVTGFLSMQAASDRQPFEPHLQRRLEQVIAEQLHAGLRVSDLARAVGLSQDYFARLFHAAYGCAPRTYLVRQRMRDAANLLTDTAMPVSAVGREVGVDNPSLFCRQFQDVMGQTPRAYRRTHGAGGIMVEHDRP